MRDIIQECFCVPEGYDGFVIGAVNAKCRSVGDSFYFYIYEIDNTDSVFYRLPALTAAN